MTEDDHSIGKQFYDWINLLMDDPEVLQVFLGWIEDNFTPTLQFLSEQEMVDWSCWCRPLNHTENPGEHISTYGQTPINNLKWTPFWWIFGPVWNNRPVKEVNDAPIKYEFVRIRPPKSHCLPLHSTASIMKSVWIRAGYSLQKAE